MTPSLLPSPAYVTTAGAAHYCAVSVRTVRRWLRIGLEFHQAFPRGKLLIRTSDLDLFLVRQHHSHPLDADIEQVFHALITRPGCGKKARAAEC